MAADIVSHALVQLLGHDRAAVLPELLLSKALSTGEQQDFDACRDAHRRVFGDCAGASSVVAAVEHLCASRCDFIARSLELQHVAAEHLWLQTPFEVASAAQRGQAAAMQEEKAAVIKWVGPDVIIHGDLGIWILRRMWLCPDFDVRSSPHRSSDQAVGAEEVHLHKRSIPIAEDELSRKRPTLCIQGQSSS